MSNKRNQIAAVLSVLPAPSAAFVAQRVWDEFSRCNVDAFETPACAAQDNVAEVLHILRTTGADVFAAALQARANEVIAILLK